MGHQLSFLLNAAFPQLLSFCLSGTQVKIVTKTEPHALQHVMLLDLLWCDICNKQITNTFTDSLNQSIDKSEV